MVRNANGTKENGTKGRKCMGSTKSAKIGVWYEMPVVRKKMVRNAKNTRVVRKAQKGRVVRNANGTKVRTR